MTADSEVTHKTFFKGDQPSRLDDAKQEAKDANAQWRAVCKLVDERDKRKCRACLKRSDPDATGLLKRGHRHHIVYRSAGGEDVSENLVTLCAECHDAEHVKRTLEIEGNADEALAFWRKDPIENIWYLWRREVAVGRFEHD